MATNANNSPNYDPTWRYLHEQQVVWLRVNLAPVDANVRVKVGSIPADAIIVKPISGVQVNTAFNAGTTNTVSIGIDGDDEFYTTGASATAVNFVPLNKNVSMRTTGVTTIYATLRTTGTSATAGQASVLIGFIQNSDRHINR